MNRTDRKKLYNMYAVHGHSNYKSSPRVAVKTTTTLKRNKQEGWRLKTPLATAAEFEAYYHAHSA